MRLFIALLVVLLRLSAPTVAQDSTGYIFLDATACPQPIDRQPVAFVVGTSDEYAPWASTTNSTFIISVPWLLNDEPRPGEDIKLRIYFSDPQGMPGDAKGLDRPYVLIDIQKHPSPDRPSTIELHYTPGYFLGAGQPGLFDAAFTEYAQDPFTDPTFLPQKTSVRPFETATVAYCRPFYSRQ